MISSFGTRSCSSSLLTLLLCFSSSCTTSIQAWISPQNHLNQHPHHHHHHHHHRSFSKNGNDRSRKPQQQHPLHHQQQQAQQQQRHAFSSQCRQTNTNGDIDTSTTSSTTSNSHNFGNNHYDNHNHNVLGGVSEFETWFDNICQQNNNKKNKAFCAPTIRHAAFGSTSTTTALRGLSCSGTEQGIIVTIPKSIVLSSTSNKDWDTQLAIQLWEECQKGTESKLYGYCSLLTLGNNMEEANYDNNMVPPSTAPNALRHWTEQQLHLLSSSSSPSSSFDKDASSSSSSTQCGQELIQLVQKQKQQWKTKYDALNESSSSSFSMTWEQFEWAMEVVHSRAFRGNDGSSSTFMWLKNQSNKDSTTTTTKDDDDNDISIIVSLLGSIMAPILSAIVGYTFLQTPNALDPSSNIILLALAAMGTLPVVLNLMKQSNNNNNNNDNNNTVVVLLPLMDSANHNVMADSQIDYNPFTKSFSLSVGSKCYVKENNNNNNNNTKNHDVTQLFISYGRKSDQELLLNYGFLPGIHSTSSNNDDCDNDMENSDAGNKAVIVMERRKLAKAFLDRNGGGGGVGVTVQQ